MSATQVPTGANHPIIISQDTLRGDGDSAARTPPGQVLTKKWPVLHYGHAPRIAADTWSMRIHGLCENPFAIDWHQLQEMPRVDLKCDIHCVTRWSRLDNIFTGVQTRTLIEMADPKPEAKFVIQHAASDPGGDWTTNVPIDEFIAEDCIITWIHDGEFLTAEHGGPVRAVVPRLYFWKGAKWISGIELVAEDAPGFWEVNGYHMRGDPWHEERYSW